VFQRCFVHDLHRIFDFCLDVETKKNLRKTAFSDLFDDLVLVDALFASVGGRNVADRCNCN
jgi:hypothetical protein